MPPSSDHLLFEDQPAATMPIASSDPIAAAVFLAKCSFLVWVQIWLRWTLPRLRVDQVMVMGYKYLIPISLFALLMMALYAHLDVRYLPGLF